MGERIFRNGDPVESTGRTSREKAIAAEVPDATTGARVEGRRGKIPEVLRRVFGFLQKPRSSQQPPER